MSVLTVPGSLPKRHTRGMLITANKKLMKEQENKDSGIETTQIVRFQDSQGQAAKAALTAIFQVAHVKVALAKVTSILRNTMSNNLSKTSTMRAPSSRSRFRLS